MLATGPIVPDAAFYAVAAAAVLLPMLITWLVMGGKLKRVQRESSATLEQLRAESGAALQAAHDGEDHRLIAQRAEALDEVSKEFAQRRMNRGLSQAVAGRSLKDVEAAVRADRAAGLSPFMIVASAGATSTGAVDDLAALADVAQRETLWFHVDAAYGGFFALTERGRAALAGIERADSVTLDPHKGLFLPYGTGCLLVREREALRRAHAVEASYLPPMQDDEDFVDFCELGPELSRDARGLRVWLPLKMHGAGVFRAALDEKLTLARRVAARDTLALLKTQSA